MEKLKPPSPMDYSKKNIKGDVLEPLKNGYNLTIRENDDEIVFFLFGFNGKNYGGREPKKGDKTWYEIYKVIDNHKNKTNKFIEENEKTTNSKTTQKKS